MTQGRMVMWSGECRVLNRSSAPTNWISKEQWEKVWTFILQSWLGSRGALQTCTTRAMSTMMERRLMRNFGEESTKVNCCHSDVMYFIESLVSPLEALWLQGGSQEHGWGRLALLTNIWSLQKQARLSEQDLCEDCLKSRVECRYFVWNYWSTLGTYGHDHPR